RHYSIKFVPPNNDMIGTRWVHKAIADERFKARLVFQDWAQNHGFDCEHTFAPVCRLGRKITL
ncbi:unnamed protein product, partial [Sphacelaria rigidula]